MVTDCLSEANIRRDAVSANSHVERWKIEERKFYFLSY